MDGSSRFWVSRAAPTPEVLVRAGPEARSFAVAIKRQRPPVARETLPSARWLQPPVAKVSR